MVAVGPKATSERRIARAIQGEALVTEASGPDLRFTAAYGVAVLLFSAAEVTAIVKGQRGMTFSDQTRTVSHAMPTPARVLGRYIVISACVWTAKHFRDVLS
jgi:hypothetical protein